MIIDIDSNPTEGYKMLIKDVIGARSHYINVKETVTFSSKAIDRIIEEALSKKERDIINHYYKLHLYDYLTIGEMVSKYNISKQAIQQKKERLILELGNPELLIDILDESSNSKILPLAKERERLTREVGRIKKKVEEGYLVYSTLKNNIEGKTKNED